jgi:DNA helicase-2/ATP-dependent DNA helicase PcrA
LEEERRLMYVALTRARRRLYLSFAQSRMLHGQTRYNVPSRFLQEIPDRLLKWLQPIQKIPVGNQQRSVTNNEPSRGTSLRGAEQDAAHAWQIGQNVIHAKFGAGVIINCEGRGAEARVEVRFGRAGTKWLLLEYAKLTPV